jgi:hypothetical protein
MFILLNTFFIKESFHFKRKIMERKVNKIENPKLSTYYTIIEFEEKDNKCEIEVSFNDMDEWKKLGYNVESGKDKNDFTHLAILFDSFTKDQVSDITRNWIYLQKSNDDIIDPYMIDIVRVNNDNLNYLKNLIKSIPNEYCFVHNILKKLIDDPLLNIVFK